MLRSPPVCLDISSPMPLTDCSRWRRSVQFVEPIVASISGSHCASAVEQIGQTGAPFSTLEDACHQAINNAILATLMISIVSYKKVRVLREAAPAVAAADAPPPQRNSTVSARFADTRGDGYAPERELACEV